MRVLLLASCALCWVYVGAQDINAMRDMPKYDQRYDYLDVDAILDSKRLVRNYVDCLINVKPCTPEGKQLRRILPEALRTKCVRCSERQKKVAVKVIHRIKSEYPEEWSKLSSRWDPTGDFTRYFEELFAKEQFNTIAADREPVTPAPRPATPPPRPPPATRPAPPPRPAPTPAVVLVTPPTPSSPPRAILLNRFGEDGELMVGETGNNAQQPSSLRPVTMLPTAGPRPLTSSRPFSTIWVGLASEPFPTRFSIRPPTDMPPLYSTTITLIDQIGLKIMRTTELVTDILRNTVRAVVGR